MKTNSSHNSSTPSLVTSEFTPLMNRRHRDRDRPSTEYRRPKTSAPSQRSQPKNYEKAFLELSSTYGFPGGMRI
ncbi:hypothetical protein BV22DRAFT_1037652 [Leucogyrophana mollusca]|uniref:Uncharacterized protein n=1 Tax=Leucogyrophana mollusca TaxID=85980 RepID=A0ACB8BAF0_9AGAM|nr:hypothetical protein BV22DRAFT_1037652 [Leucogyrophana mollusca]